MGEEPPEAADPAGGGTVVHHLYPVPTLLLLSLQFMVFGLLCLILTY